MVNKRIAWVAAGVVLFCGTAFGQSGFGLLTGRDVGNIRGSVRGEASHAFEVDVEDSAFEMAMSRYELSLSVPVSQRKGEEDLSLQLFTGLMDVRTDAVFPDNGFDFPDELYDVELGATYRRTLDNGWVAGGNLMVGSPSDEPFDSWDEIAINGNAFLRIPDGKNAWLLFLNYSNTRDFAQNIPLPGFGYEYNGEQLKALLGIPFSSVDWRPVEDLSLTARYFIVREIDVRATYRVAEPLRVYVGYSWSHDRFLRADRDDEDDRLFFYEQRATAGVRWDVSKDLALDLFGGWAFDRFWFEGEDYDDRHDNRLDLEDGPFVGVSLVWRF